KADKIFNYEFAYYSSLVDHSRRTYTKDGRQDPQCFAHTYYDSQSRWSMSDFQFTYTLGFIYGGGAGTTSSVMQSFCLAMCHYPKWQSQLQKEVDEVVGPNRIPTFEDMPNLPTVRAIIKETLRWRPVVPGGIPHQLSQDDEYQGYHIPKGSVIHANQYAMVREEALYPDSEAFNPGRWLNPKYPTYQEPLSQFPNLKRYLTFGFGRRICPGLELAERALFIQVSHIAWACSIQLKKDEYGSTIPAPWYDYAAGVNTRPNAFSFDMKPRSEDRLRIMQRTVESI
ncbi:cytochrome P450, partial [Dactylonectria estremocensis]